MFSLKYYCVSFFMTLLLQLAIFLIFFLFKFSNFRPFIVLYLKVPKKLFQGITEQILSFANFRRERKKCEQIIRKKYVFKENRLVNFFVFLFYLFHTYHSIFFIFLLRFRQPKYPRTTNQKKKKTCVWRKTLHNIIFNNNVN